MTLHITSIDNTIQKIDPTSKDLIEARIAAFIEAQQEPMNGQTLSIIFSIKDHSLRLLTEIFIRGSKMVFDLNTGVPLETNLIPLPLVQQLISDFEEEVAIHAAAPLIPNDLKHEARDGKHHEHKKNAIKIELIFEPSIGSITMPQEITEKSNVVIKIKDTTEAGLGDGASELIHEKFTKLLQHYKTWTHNNPVHVFAHKENGLLKIHADITIQGHKIFCEKKGNVHDFSHILKELTMAMEHQLEKLKSTGHHHSLNKPYESLYEPDEETFEMNPVIEEDLDIIQTGLHYPTQTLSAPYEEPDPYAKERKGDGK